MSPNSLANFAIKNISKPLLTKALRICDETNFDIDDIISSLLKELPVDAFSKMLINHEIGFGVCKSQWGTKYCQSCYYLKRY